MRLCRERVRKETGRWGDAWGCAGVAGRAGAPPIQLEVAEGPGSLSGLSVYRGPQTSRPRGHAGCSGLGQQEGCGSHPGGLCGEQLCSGSRRQRWASRGTHPAQARHPLEHPGGAGPILSEPAAGFPHGGPGEPPLNGEGEASLTEV